MVTGKAKIGVSRGRRTLQRQGPQQATAAPPQGGFQPWTAAQDIAQPSQTVVNCCVRRSESFACQSRGQGRSRRQDAVKQMLKQDIVREATRLTRAGQLVEATVLLQRMLRGETAPEATSAGRIALTGPKPLIID